MARRMIRVQRKKMCKASIERLALETQASSGNGVSGVGEEGQEGVDKLGYAAGASWRPKIL